jgi:uncharacterized metal-binding protein YceD (DUF177 family)
MSGLFTVPISGLKEGHHIFDFEIGKKFFEMFEESEIKEGMLVAITEIEKGSTHINLDIKISGSVRICCDRCLEMFDLPVACENRLVIKFGPVRDESDPDILTLPVDEHESILQYFYEFIYLALPIQKYTPMIKTEKAHDPFILQKLRSISKR